MENKTKRRTLDEQIAFAQKELEQKEARVKDLLGRQRSKEDKARTNRLCRRGGLVEKLHPRLAKFTDEQFNLFVDLVLKSDQTKSVLDEIMPPEPDEADNGTGAQNGTAESKPLSPDGKPPQAATQGNTPPTQKNVNTPHNGGNNDGGNNQPHNSRPANQQHHNGANGNGNGSDGARPTS